MKKLISLVLVMVMLFAMAACGGSTTKATDPPAADPTDAPVSEATDPPAEEPTDDPAPSEVDVVKVGGKDFTEQLILAQITIQLLEANGIPTKDVSNVAGSDTCRTALSTGDFGLYWEYTGTAWAMLIQSEGEMPNEPQALFDAVKEADAANGYTWLQYAPMNNTYALAMRSELADELGITSYTELGEYITANPGSLVLACDHEFTAREDGLPGLVSTYGTDFGDDLNIMDMGLVFQAVANDQADVVMVFATDGRIKANDLVVLKDDKNFFPVYNGAPCVRDDVLAAFPEIESLLAEVAALLTDEVMQELNLKVDGDEFMEPNEVAEEWLIANGFI